MARPDAGHLIRKEVSGMKNECEYEAHPVWGVLDALGVEYERIEQ